MPVCLLRDLIGFELRWLIYLFIYQIFLFFFAFKVGSDAFFLLVVFLCFRHFSHYVWKC